MWGAAFQSSGGNGHEEVGGGWLTPWSYGLGRFENQEQLD